MQYAKYGSITVKHYPKYTAAWYFEMARKYKELKCEIHNVRLQADRDYRVRYYGTILLICGTAIGITGKILQMRRQTTQVAQTTADLHQQQH